MGLKATGEISAAEADVNLAFAFNHPGKGYELARRLQELTLTRNVLWVSTTGDSSRGYGSYGEPYATLEAAVAAMTATKLTVALMPGDYTLAAAVTPPVLANGGRIVAPYGGVKIIESGSFILDIDPAAAGAAWEFSIENVKIQHTACVGLQIDNSVIVQNLTVNLRNVEFDMVSSGNSIDIDHTDAAKYISLNIDNNGEIIEGAINAVIGNNADEIRIHDARVMGGIVTDAGAFTAELFVESSEVKHEGITGGAAQQIINAINCWTVVAEAYARLDTSDLAGSHTEVIQAALTTDFGAGGLDTDVIDESTGAAGVTIEGVLVKDSMISVDVINEASGATGVTLDGVLLKDSEVTTDVINEKTGSAGVTIDGSLIKDLDIKVDTVSESTPAAGVTVDGVLLKDSAVNANTVNEGTAGSGVTIDGMLVKDNVPYADVIGEIAGSGNGVTVDGVLLKDGVPNVDVISEASGATGVTIDGVLNKDAEIYTDVVHEAAASGNGVAIDGMIVIDGVPYADVISEIAASGLGVTVDGVQLKDSEVYTDVIHEKTGATGVTIDGMVIKDNIPYADVISEISASGNGVTVDGVLLKDSEVTTDVINEKTGATGVTIDGVLLKDLQVSTDVINELSGAAGVTIDGVLLKDSEVTTDVINEKTGATGVTADGVVLKDSGVLAAAEVMVNVGAATAAVAIRLGGVATEGYEIKVLDEDVVFGAALASVDLTQDIPTGAVILSCQLNNETAVTGAGGATKVGLGDAANPDQYGLTADLIKNTKFDVIPPHAVLAAPEDLKVYAVDNAGAAAGTLDACTVRVMIVYAVLNSLVDAA